MPAKPIDRLAPHDRIRHILLILSSQDIIWYFVDMSPKPSPMLSKSRFLAGVHCPLRLWYTCYNPELATAVSPVQQAIFDTGHEVGILATRVYPGGVLIEEDYLHHEGAVHSTRAMLKDPGVPAIFEGAFVYDGVRIRADILQRLEGDRWQLIEVKSSTSVKDYYLYDVAVQCHVLKGSGLPIDRAGIMYLNNQYLFDGKNLELASLFSFFDLTMQVVEIQDAISSQIGELKEMLAGTSAPDIVPSRSCNSPYNCEFWEHCIKGKPEFWVVRFSGLSQKQQGQLAELGIYDIRHIPESFPLSKMQERIRECTASGAVHVAPELLTDLTDVEYPLHFLDFETLGTAIPRYAGTRPYQPIPFQWSDHILSEDGSIHHHEYLCVEDKDPRQEFAETLLETLKDKGTIIVYTAYEERVIKGLIEFLPAHRNELLKILDRFKDLHVMMRKYVYHPEFQGSFSLKALLPALVPSMDYGQLSIQDGQHASVEYLRMLDPNMPEHEREEMREDLLNYCSNDTLGMVRIWEKLLSLLRQP
jgi:hypothetical protein